MRKFKGNKKQFRFLDKKPKMKISKDVILSGMEFAKTFANYMQDQDCNKQIKIKKNFIIFAESDAKGGDGIYHSVIYDNLSKEFFVKVTAPTNTAFQHAAEVFIFEKDSNLIAIMQDILFAEEI